MKNRLTWVVLFLFGSMLLSDCSCKHVCSQAIPMLDLSNFDSTTLDTVIVKMYEQTGVPFTKLDDSETYSSTVQPPYSNYNNHMDSDRVFLDFTHDYVIQIPANGRSWYIKNINLIATEMENTTSCTGGMSYYLNDTIHSVVPNSTTSYSKTLIKLK